MTLEEIDRIVVEYAEKMGEIPHPIGIDEETLAKVLREHLDKGEPVPEDYDWYEGFPEDADV